MNWKSLLGGGSAAPEPEPKPGFADFGPGVPAMLHSDQVVPHPPPAAPGLEWWWLVLHRGHEAFYLRALMAGDFAPGHLPLPRHARPLDAAAAPPPACGTCGEVPAAADLEVVERSTGARRFLDAFRAGRAKWPKPTDPASCWECCSRTLPAIHDVDGVKVCAGCAAHLTRERR